MKQRYHSIMTGMILAMSYCESGCKEYLVHRLTYNMSENRLGQYGASHFRSSVSRLDRMVPINCKGGNVELCEFPKQNASCRQRNSS